MVSRKLAVTGTIAACAACCAPLIVPIVLPVLATVGLVGAGGIGGGWLAGLSLDAMLCGGIALAVTTGGAVWLWQRSGRLRAHVPRHLEGAQCDLETCGPARARDS